MFTALTQVLDGLRRRYAEPHRAYHGQAHVDAMLRGLDAIRPDFARPEAAELAVWFHDAVYDPAATDNEARSAALMMQQMGGLADPALLDRAATMIHATAGHAVPPGPASGPASGLAPGLVRDIALFLDLDLAVLGAAPAAYDAYERGIAAEYAPVHGEARFRAGRLAFLQAMLVRPRLFLTPEAQDRLDAPARANIARAIVRLDEARPDAAPSPK